MVRLRGECDKKNLRFHAFLKKCERRPECSRQTLTELMIRPVQRLPSISLLLNDLLKHTKRGDPGHPDCIELEKALAKIKEVMTHLNEEKRRTEGQIHIFDIYSRLRTVQPVLCRLTGGMLKSIFMASVKYFLSSSVCRADAIEVDAEDALFVFTDILVVTKRKNMKGMSMLMVKS